MPIGAVMSGDEFHQRDDYAHGDHPHAPSNKMAIRN
jgi:hypothetical protein